MTSYSVSQLFPTYYSHSNIIFPVNYIMHSSPIAIPTYQAYQPSPQILNPVIVNASHSMLSNSCGAMASNNYPIYISTSAPMVTYQIPSNFYTTPYSYSIPSNNIVYPNYYSNPIAPNLQAPISYNGAPILSHPETFPETIVRSVDQSPSANSKDLKSDNYPTIMSKKSTRDSQTQTEGMNQHHSSRSGGSGIGRSLVLPAIAKAIEKGLRVNEKVGVQSKFQQKHNGRGFPNHPNPPSSFAPRDSWVIIVNERYKERCYC